MRQMYRLGDKVTIADCGQRDREILVSRGGCNWIHPMDYTIGSSGTIIQVIASHVDDPEEDAEYRYMVQIDSTDVRFWYVDAWLRPLGGDVMDESPYEVGEKVILLDAKGMSGWVSSSMDELIGHQITIFGRAKCGDEWVYKIEEDAERWWFKHKWLCRVDNFCEDNAALDELFEE